MTTGIFFGSTTGNTESVAQEIAQTLGIDAADIHNVGTTDASEVQNYDTILLGSSTWGCGDLQDDWTTSLMPFPRLTFRASVWVSSVAATAIRIPIHFAVHWDKSMMVFKTRVAPS